MKKILLALMVACAVAPDYYHGTSCHSTGINTF